MKIISTFPNWGEWFTHHLFIQRLEYLQWILNQCDWYEIIENLTPCAGVERCEINMSRRIVLDKTITFEPDKKKLSTMNKEIVISASASYCLLLLIERKGELVSHEDLFEFAWRRFGMEVSANALYQNILVIRRGLKECGMQENIIRTMPRRGFSLSQEINVSFDNEDFLAGAAISARQCQQPDNSPLRYAAEAAVVEVPAIDSEVKLLSEATAKMEMNNNRKVAGSLLKIILLFVCAVVIIAGVVLIYSYFHFINSYHLIYRDFGCEIYSQKDNVYDDKTLGILRAKMFLCYRKGFLHVTQPPKSERLSLIFCEQKLGKIIPPNCDSYYYLGER